MTKGFYKQTKLFSTSLLCGLLILQTTTVFAQEKVAYQKPVWTKSISTKKSSVLNTDVGTERGVLEKGGRSLEIVDSLHGVLLVLSGDADKLAELYCIAAETGEVIWRKDKIQLNQAKPLSHYGGIGLGKSYLARVVGGLALLSVVKGKSSGLGNCTDEPELIALDIKDGRLVWCNHRVAVGELTLLTFPEKQIAIAWNIASKEYIPLYAIDLRTGETKWESKLDIKNGKDWERYLGGSPLAQTDSIRSPIHDDNGFFLPITELKRYGPILKMSKDFTLRKYDLDTGKVLWQASIGMLASWKFFDKMIIAVGSEGVVALDNTTGNKLWEVNDIKGYFKVEKFVNDNDSFVLLQSVSYDGVSMVLRSHKLIALDARSGNKVWEYSNDKIKHSYFDAKDPWILLSDEKSVIGLDILTGKEVFKINTSLEKKVRSVRLIGVNKVVAQSDNQIVAYDPASGREIFNQIVLPPRRSKGEIISSLVWIAATPFLPFPPYLAFLKGSMISGTISDLNRDRTVKLQNLNPNYSYFVTGVGDDLEMVGVSARTGQSEVISPFVNWRQGNLVDEFHGVAYVVHKNAINAYQLKVAPEYHNVIHFTSGLNLGYEYLDRATAFKEKGERDKAAVEYKAASKEFEAALNLATEIPDLLSVHRGLGETSQGLGEVGSKDEQKVQFSKAIEAYRKVIELAKQSSDGQFANWAKEAEERIAKLRAL